MTSIIIKEQLFPESKDKLVLAINEGKYLFTGQNKPKKVTAYELFYGEYDVELNGYMVHQIEYFHLKDYEMAIAAFRLRFKSDTPGKSTRLGTSLENIFSHVSINEL